MQCSLPGSSVHELFQARILEWVAISFSCDLLFALRVFRVSIYGAISLFLTTMLSKLGGGCCVLSAIVFAAVDLL